MRQVIIHEGSKSGFELMSLKDIEDFELVFGQGSTQATTLIKTQRARNQAKELLAVADRARQVVSMFYHHNKEDLSTNPMLPWISALDESLHKVGPSH